MADISRLQAENEKLQMSDVAKAMSAMLSPVILSPVPGDVSQTTPISRPLPANRQTAASRPVYHAAFAVQFDVAFL